MSDVQGLILGMDYTNEYCQVCYYSRRHNRPESIMAGVDASRYLIPVALCYDAETKKWLIGYEAMECSQVKGIALYGDFLINSTGGKMTEICGTEFSYRKLFAIFIGKLLETTQLVTGMQTISSITVTLRKVTTEFRLEIEDVFADLGIEKDRLKLLSFTECYAYYVLKQDYSLWKEGALLLDFTSDGFFVKLLKIMGQPGKELVYVDEDTNSFEFSVKDLGSESAARLLDGKLNRYCEDLLEKHNVSSVFFTGSGFDDMWFTRTLTNISEKCRAFKGNNLYVKGACFSGLMRLTEQSDYPIMCKERTKVRISIDVRQGQTTKRLVLSEAAVGWYDAGCAVDLITDETEIIVLYITSILSLKTYPVEFGLGNFPQRPNKTTRLELLINYLNDLQCEISITDKGFGDFFKSDNMRITKLLDMEKYI